MLHYGFEIGLVFLGAVLAVIYNANIREFWLWIRCSAEENEGRASGKSLSMLALVITFISMAIYVCHQHYINGTDFQPNQTVIINNIISSRAFQLQLFQFYNSLHYPVTYYLIRVLSPG